MGKYADSLNDFCPDCANENESDQNVVSSCDESCCCCCCSCENSEVETTEANEMCSDARKKELLSNLTRPNRQQASIQNVLQYIEALTHSGNFLSRYFSMEDFCLDCLTEPICDCYARSFSNLNVSDACTCSACVVGEHSQNREAGDNDCPECSTNPTAVSPGRSEKRGMQGRRRRRRPRNRRSATPSTPNQSFEFPRSNESETSRETICNDPECSEEYTGPRHHRREYQNNDRCCTCEECNVLDKSKRNGACTCILPNTTEDSVDQCRECASEFLNSTSCQLSDCEECRRENPTALNDYGASCSGENCCSCIQPAASSCSDNPRRKTRNLMVNKRKSLEDSSEGNNPTTIGESSKDDDGTCESCDCADCQNGSEYSEDSCDECCNQSSKNKNRKKS